MELVAISITGPDTKWLAEYAGLLVEEQNPATIVTKAEPADRQWVGTETTA